MACAFANPAKFICIAVTSLLVMGISSCRQLPIKQGVKFRHLSVNAFQRMGFQAFHQGKIVLIRLLFQDHEHSAMKPLFYFSLGVILTFSICSVDWMRAVVKLGISPDELASALSKEVKLNGGGPLYPQGHVHTREELERDVRFYFEDRPTENVTVFYGFNAEKKLIQIIETKKRKMFPDPNTHPILDAPK